MNQVLSTVRRPARYIVCHARRKKSTLDTVSDEWLSSLKNKLKPSTLSAYGVLLRAHIIPYFGGRCTEDITQEDIETFFILKSQSLSAATLSNISAVLRSLLKYGGAREMDWELPRARDGGQAKVLDSASKNALERHLIYNIYSGDCESAALLLCLYTGLRIGELCALRWSDISLEAGTVSIRRTVQRIYQGEGTSVVFGTPKSRDSCRVIPLPAFITDILAPFRQDDSFYVLTGGPDFMEPRTLQNHFKKLLRECGLPDINFHAIRHTFATGCVEIGFDPKTLCSILGHADVSTTLNTYVHPSMAAKRAMMDRLSQMTPFAKGGTGTRPSEKIF